MKKIYLLLVSCTLLVTLTACSTKSISSRINKNTSSRINKNTSSKVEHKKTKKKKDSIPKSTNSNKTPENNSTNENTNINLVENELKKGFVISPLLYNGENIDRAMEEKRAPQSLVHDATIPGYLTDNNQVRILHFSTVFDKLYTITNNTLTIFSHTFNYTVSNGQVSFTTETIKSGSNTITMELLIDPSQKEIIDNYK